jgi:excinuclease ABC subunit A
MLKTISIQGAREHNLKDVNLEIPRDKLVVITGLSGSGKSSLAFDTIYAEGQRRYVESLSAYARQFLELMQKPDVDSIEGLSPAISIEQKTTSKNPRSTVGTVTEIYDYMRLLWARVGVPYSPATGEPIASQTVSQMVDRIKEMGEGTRLYILSPIVRGRKGEYKKEFKDLLAKGFQRVKVDGELFEIDDVPALEKNIKHDIEVVVDRLVIKDDLGNRLADSIETALRLSDGLVFVEDADTKDTQVMSEKFACPVSGFTIEEIEPRLFSFNNPRGACETCDGLGVRLYFDEALIVPDSSKTIAEGAIKPWSRSFSHYYNQALEQVINFYGESTDTPYDDLSDELKHSILYGSGNQKIPIIYEDRANTYRTNKPFEGVINNMKRRLLETQSGSIRDDLAKYQSSAPCEVCQGYRLNQQALSVKIDMMHISEVTEFSILEAHKWFLALEGKLTKQQSEIANRILKEINERLLFLMNVGLEYLNLSRSSGTLSGGESQRIRLASQIGSGLTGVLYVLDEPSIGLHQRDNNRLLKTLKRLRDLGNTVLVVEHDEDAMLQADYIIDIGPGAGRHGGQVVAAGTPEELLLNDKSLTAQYLSGKKKIPVPKSRKKAKDNKKLTVYGATGHNLKNVDVAIPIGCFTCVTGVSGSGKSSFTIETLYKAVSQKLLKSRHAPLPYKKISGLEYIDKVIDIDQSPIGRTPRSNPATYTGAFGPIREWYSGLPEAKARGYKPGRFSFNVKGGRCEACSGDGVIKIEMHFLPDVYVSCDTCKGKRYNRETLEIKFKNNSIADVLAMTVEEAAEFFKAVPSIRDKLETLKSVGLGYLQLGQQATTLSGGEAQRIKLSKELSKRSTGKTLYILDEPTTGLHYEDVKNLLHVLHRLVEQGNTVVVIEHNLEVIKTADHIIDIGPEGGDMGGQVVAYGTPEEICKSEQSYTGQFLQPILTDTPQKLSA